MKQKHEQFILNIIATIIGAFIAGYVLAYITFGVKRFILSVIIILVTFIVINSLYKITKNYFILYEKIIMIENTLEEGKRFLISYLRNKNIDYETIHP